MDSAHAAEGAGDAVRYVAFLRAVNVAGHARVPTRALVRAFEAAGLENVESFYASGNIMFDSPPGALALRLKRVRQKLRRVLGEAPELFVRTPAELARLLRQPPFSTRQRRSRDKLWVAFMRSARSSQARLPHTITRERLSIVAVSGREAFAVSKQKPTGFYAIPNPLIEAALGVRSTCRQWSTVTTIAAKLGVETATADSSLRSE